MRNRKNRKLLVKNINKKGEQDWSSGRRSCVMSQCCHSWDCHLSHLSFCVWHSAGLLFQRPAWVDGSIFRDFSLEWEVRQPWHISFIFLWTNRKRKNIKKIKYILTDIHKHQHEGQNNGKEVTVWHYFMSERNGYERNGKYEQYTG